jgi:hypothetical protein
MPSESNRLPSYDPARHDVPMRSWTVLAQDPGLLGPSGRALTTTVTIAAERLERGPKGHRVHVIDYDASSDTFYQSRQSRVDEDIFAKVTDNERLVRDLHFHQQNVYAIAMATLQEFECALGRRVGWGFGNPSHQLKIAPHAYEDANAAYSRESESLTFGYYRHRGQRVYTCLSHDIVAHETTHALLDGLRPFYLNPSSPDQAAFHEGFSDIVALLSVFRSQEVVERALVPLTGRDGRVPFAKLTVKDLGDTALMRLAEQMGGTIPGVPSDALRHSLKIRPSAELYASDRFDEEHERGELLVAIVIRALLQTWVNRLKPLRAERITSVSRAVAAEEGTTAARHLLRIAIRALDYLPPVDLSFPDYLSALLTADAQLNPDDTRYGYRDSLRSSFEKFGVTPGSKRRKDGLWEPPSANSFSLAGTHFDGMQRDPSEVFRFVWENAVALDIDRSAFTRVTSVRPVVRVSNDQSILRETVVEYVQSLKVFSSELASMGIRKPDAMPTNLLITLYGGGSLIFSEYGQLKFHVGTGVRSPRQSGRLQSLWDRGELATPAPSTARIRRMHQARALRPSVAKGGW